MGKWSLKAGWFPVEFPISSRPNGAHLGNEGSASPGSCSARARTVPASPPPPAPFQRETLLEFHVVSQQANTAPKISRDPDGNPRLDLIFLGLYTFTIDCAARLPRLGQSSFSSHERIRNLRKTSGYCPSVEFLQKVSFVLWRLNSQTRFWVPVKC